MSRIDDIFRTLAAEGRSALMPFVTGGYPSMDATRRVIPALEQAGASIVELGIPFTDPIADGPVIAASMHEALMSGVTPGAILDLTAKLRPQTELGLLAMLSHSIVRRMGTEAFIRRAAEAGIDGLIVPDIDTSEAGVLGQMAAERDMSFSMLIAPTTTDKRLAVLAQLSSGFVYLLARVGITGVRDEPPDVSVRVAQVRQHTDLPIAVGFGISTAAHVAAVARQAEAAIVGSALVMRMGESDDPVTAAEQFVRDLATGLTAAAS